MKTKSKNFHRISRLNLVNPSMIKVLLELCFFEILHQSSTGASDLTVIIGYSKGGRST